MARKDIEKDAAFCEALANGLSILASGKLIGNGSGPAQRRFERIRRELGEQAK